MPIEPFNASFVYTASGSKVADGIAMILQNDPRGINALGGGGGNLGYGTGSQITNSVGIGLNIYSNANPLGTGAGTGVYELYNGNIVAAGTPSSTFFGSGDAINVDVYYNGLNTLTATFSDTTANLTYTTSYSLPSNIATLVSGTSAYIGFTGADGGAVATQLISNFNFSASSSLASLNDVLPTTTALAIAAGATVDLFGTSQTVGDLSGSGTVTTSVAGVTSTLSVGTDNTSQTFSGLIQNGAGTVALTKVGGGKLTLANANAYSGGTYVGGGTLQLGNSASLGFSSGT